MGRRSSVRSSQRTKEKYRNKQRIQKAHARLKPKIADPCTKVDIVGRRVAKLERYLAEGCQNQNGTSLGRPPWTPYRPAWFRGTSDGGAGAFVWCEELAPNKGSPSVGEHAYVLFQVHHVMLMGDNTMEFQLHIPSCAHNPHRCTTLPSEEEGKKSRIPITEFQLRDEHGDRCSTTLYTSDPVHGIYFWDSEAHDIALARQRSWMVLETFNKEIIVTNRSFTHTKWTAALDDPSTRNDLKIALDDVLFGIQLIVLQVIDFLRFPPKVLPPNLLPPP